MKETKNVGPGNNNQDEQKSIQEKRKRKEK